MRNPNIALESEITFIFPDILVHDERPGYEGYIIKSEHILTFMQKIRDDLGYDYLSSVTGVDYLPDGKMEIVYHVRKSTGGSPLVVKAFQVFLDRS